MPKDKVHCREVKQSLGGKSALLCGIVQITQSISPSLRQAQKKREDMKDAEERDLLSQTQDLICKSFSLSIYHLFIVYLSSIYN